MARHSWFALLLVFAVLAPFGCYRGPVTWQRVTLNQPIAADDVRFIVDGETPLAAVVNRLGAPTQMLPSTEGVVTRYQFTDGKYFRADYGWGLRFFVPFFAPDLVLGGGGLGTDVFQVTYDKNWIVRDHAFASHSHSSEFMLWPFRD